jgi:hypothetical protein
MENLNAKFYKEPFEYKPNTQLLNEINKSIANTIQERARQEEFECVKFIFDFMQKNFLTTKGFTNHFTLEITNDLGTGTSEMEIRKRKRYERKQHKLMEFLIQQKTI